MKVKIGIAETPRELVVSSDRTPDEVAQLVSGALKSDDGLLDLTDDQGNRFVVPVARISYVEIGPGEERKVGFGLGGKP
ncbi:MULTISPECIES: DUF3107 domain-containing protein [Pseudonocardia]|uniref:ATP-binding protein n=2 Tax=Pseudonocardia TaxID=1847 RepID=A0A1Y2N4R0_PSEAH|nr:MULTISPECIES: DUF3107 domain-containing protein [Pseudonocardia]OSY42473.1 hypothetical protein BG845_01393 [Pseudonocardia autotrophica]TDN75992.1 uncharacterized protein DUF3107 [Pseudonocardia autotrophica]BBF99967.1 hypothetical protein Pdca_11770 [Pseudonocardia autotrophica]GEC25027.1 hypothetical protein PSA01_20560 [Pseudonocardia saturnea]